MNSPMFGKIEELTDEEEQQLVTIGNKNPVRLFQTVNLKLNEKGFCSSIVPIENKKD